MKKIGRIISACGVLTVLAIAGLWVTVKSSAQNNRESASGHGTFLVVDENGRTVRRQFSFHAKRNNDGTVSGSAVLHNPAFNGANGNNYQAHFDISCMKVVGNTAVFGGFVRRTNDPNLMDAAFFSVQDNGEPGKNRDLLSSVYFWDGDPNTTGDPSVCEITPPFPMSPIDGGNIQVKP